MLCCENISTRLSQQLSAIIIMIICYVHIKAKGSDEIMKIKQHQMNADHAPVKAPQSCVIGNLNQLINISQERRAFENSSKLFNSFRKLQTKKPNTKARRCLDSTLKGETWTHTVPNEIDRKWETETASSQRNASENPRTWKHWTLWKHIFSPRLQWPNFYRLSLHNGYSLTFILSKYLLDKRSRKGWYSEAKTMKIHCSIQSKWVVTTWEKLYG